MHLIFPALRVRHLETLEIVDSIYSNNWLFSFLQERPLSYVNWATGPHFSVGSDYKTIEVASGPFTKHLIPTKTFCKETDYLYHPSWHPRVCEVADFYLMNSWASSCLPYPRWLPILRIRESMLIGEKGIWFPLAFWTCFWSSHMKHQSCFIPGEQNNSVHALWGREGALLVLKMISHLKQLISWMSLVVTKPHWGDWGKPYRKLTRFAMITFKKEGSERTYVV